jgi:hypothetical protein
MDKFLLRHLDALQWGQKIKLPGLQTVSGARLSVASGDRDRLE